MSSPNICGNLVDGISVCCEARSKVINPNKGGFITFHQTQFGRMQQCISYHEQGFLRPPRPATFQLLDSWIEGIHFVSSANPQVPSPNYIVCERNVIFESAYILQNVISRYGRECWYLYVLRWCFLSLIRPGFPSIMTLWTDLAAFTTRSERNLTNRK